MQLPPWTLTNVAWTILTLFIGIPLGMILTAAIWQLFVNSQYKCWIRRGCQGKFWGCCLGTHMWAYRNKSVHPLKQLMDMSVELHPRIVAMKSMMGEFTRYPNMGGGHYLKDVRFCPCCKKILILHDVIVRGEKFLRERTPTPLEKEKLAFLQKDTLPQWKDLGF